MRCLIKYCLVSVFFLSFCSLAMAEQNDSGKEGALTITQKASRNIKWLKTLPDGNQPMMSESKFVFPTRGVVGVKTDKDQKPIQEVTDARVPVWKGLDKLSRPERKNALLHLKVFSDLSSSMLREIDNIEALWNSGNYDQAVERLRSFEESDDQRDILVGAGWKTPRMTSEPKWGTDVRIGERHGIRETCMDFDNGTGNLFAAIMAYDGEFWRVHVYFSPDDGQNWYESFWLWGVNEINDISGVVLHGYFYIGVTVSWNEKVALYRFSVTTGVQDYDYEPEYPIDEGYDVLEIAFTSNADYADNRIYLLAILASDSLIYRWSNEGAVTWYDIPTYVANADHGLDACYNEGASGYFVFVSLVDHDGRLRVARKSLAGWGNIDLDYADEKTSIAAYDDRIITAFEYIYPDGQGIKYWISYEGGEEWRWGSVAEPSPGQHFTAPDVAARRGGGMGVVYSEEVGEPDPCWYRHREYGTGPGTATWSDPEQFNEQDVATGFPMTIEWIPPLSPYCHAHGTIWIGGSEIGAYFDRIDREMPGDANGDGVVNSADVVYLIDYLFKSGPAPEPVRLGDVNCDEIVNSADVVYLINYLFKGGPPPCCP